MWAAVWDRSELITSSMRHCKPKLSGAKLSSFTLIKKKKKNYFKGFPGFLGVRQLRIHVSGQLSSLISPWDGDSHLLPTCSCSGRNHAQKLLGSTGGVQWCRSPSGWHWSAVCKVEALLARKKGMEFIRWKVNLLTCEAVVCTYSEQMLVPEAKYPSSRTNFLLYFELQLPFPHPDSSKQDTEKYRKQKGSTDSFGCSWFFFLKGQWTNLPEEALSLNTWELTSTKVTQQKQEAEMEELHYGIFS